MSTFQPDFSKLPAFDNTLGALQISLIVSALLFGITCVQAYTYFSKCENDHNVLKYSVALLCCLETVHLVLVEMASYHYMVKHFADPLVMLTVPWSLSAAMVVTAFVFNMITAIYAHRIWKLNGRKAHVPLVVLVLGTTSFVTASVSAIGSALQPDITKPAKVGDRMTNICANVAWYTAIVTEVIIASSLVYFLRKCRSGMKRTETLVSILIKYTLATGALSSVVQVTTVITNRYAPSSLIYAGIIIVHSKLYFNALLAMLNARENLRDKIDAMGISSLVTGFNTNCTVAAPAASANDINRNDRGSESDGSNSELPDIMFAQKTTQGTCASVHTPGTTTTGVR